MAVLIQVTSLEAVHQCHTSFSEATDYFHSIFFSHVVVDFDPEMFLCL